MTHGSKTLEDDNTLKRFDQIWISIIDKPSVHNATMIYTGPNVGLQDYYTPIIANIASLRDLPALLPQKEESSLLAIDCTL